MAGGNGQQRPRNNSQSKLDALRNESRVRLRQNIPYQPNQADNQLRSGRDQTPTQNKDLSYYTGSSSKPNQKRGNSNLRLDDKLNNYQPQSANLMQNSRRH